MPTLSDLQVIPVCDSSEADPLPLPEEWEAARNIQEHLLPCETLRSGPMEYFARTERCGRLGGDFFGFVVRPEGRLHAVIGNVSPSGAPAGLATAALQSALRVLLEREADLTVVVRDLNHIAWDLSADNVLGTLLCVTIDPVQQRLEYVSAGEDLALIVRSGSRVPVRLDATGAVLGLRRQSPYRLRSVAFARSDVFVALSQGAARDLNDLAELTRLVTEARHPLVRDPAAYLLNSTEFQFDAQERAVDRTAAVVRFGVARGGCTFERPGARSLPCLKRAAAA